MTLVERVVRRFEAKKALDLSIYGLEGMVEHRPVTLYHGTTSLFKAFSLQVSRTELVDQYYGAGIFLTPSKRVAEKYAYANRNIGFPPSIIADLKRKNPRAGEFVQNLHDRGNDAWDDLTPEKLGVSPGEEFHQAVQNHVGGVDPNTLADICRFIVGSKLVSERSPDNEPINIFNMSTGLPDYVYGYLDEVGLDSKTYRPKVYTVTVLVSKVLVTTSKSQAKSAHSKGYDSVVYHGSDLVDGTPEVAVYNPRDVRIKHIEVV